MLDGPDIRAGAPARGNAAELLEARAGTPARLDAGPGFCGGWIVCSHAAILAQRDVRADTGAAFASSRDRFVLGTHESPDVLLHDSTVSHFHCENAPVEVRSSRSTSDLARS